MRRLLRKNLLGNYMSIINMGVRRESKILSSENRKGKQHQFLTTLLSLTFCLVIGACSPSERLSAPKADTPFIIAVVGSGVPSDKPVQSRVFPLNRVQGKAMWEGVKAALQSPDLRGISKVVTLVGFDDGDQSRDASDIAESLVDWPSVIAVIGHAISDTTRAAASIYSDACIPLIMPIATSPTASVPPGGKINEALSNCFRLPPRDDTVQAPAIAFMVDTLKSKRCYLIRDDSEGASIYSNPLGDKLQYLLSERNLRTSSVSYSENQYLNVASVIQAEKSDAVIFCGYGSNANGLIHALRRMYGENSSDAPTLILTDGCWIPDLDVSGFTSYLTFPLAPLPSGHGSRNLELLRETVENPNTPSYAVFGFDAMLILGTAILKCHGESGASRQSIVRMLQQQKTWEGVVHSYSFDEGDNALSEYSIYKVTFDKTIGKSQFVLYTTIDRHVITQYNRKIGAL